MRASNEKNSKHKNYRGEQHKQKLLIAFFVCIVCAFMLGSIAYILVVDDNNKAIASGIRKNAFSTMKEIRSYHVVLKEESYSEKDNISKPEVLGNSSALSTLSEVWFKGPNRYRINTKSSGMEELEIAQSEVTITQNGRTILIYSQESEVIIYNSPPFDDLYGNLYCPYDIAGELNALCNEDEISIVGEEKHSCGEAYKVEKKIEGDKSVSSNSVDREILWVAKDSSLCLKKEKYIRGKLISSLDILSYELNIDIPEDFFSIEVGNDKHIEERDGRYRELNIEKANETCGFNPIAPGYLPEGYCLSSTGWRDPRPAGIPLDCPPEYQPLWFKPMYITYDNGFSEINICEAKKNDFYAVGDKRKIDKRQIERGLLDVDMSGENEVWEIRLRGGNNAYYNADTITLSFIYSDVKVRIKAKLPLEELIKIAESFKPL
ncbi:MAG: hypothetical protein H5T73_04475 [Actinobacteria bacterium]|nr:hypothetical protein [Actinomycetota bacterium]